MRLPEINLLPETLEPSELRDLFLRVLSAEASKLEKIQTLLDLAEKQWHCYEPLSSDLSTKISAYVATSWNAQDQKTTEILVGIVGMLGLSEVMRLIFASASDLNVPPFIRSELNAAVQEFGPLPLDPYRGMPKSGRRD